MHGPVIPSLYQKYKPFAPKKLGQRLSQDGWAVPIYTLPGNLEDVCVMRLVIKENTTMDMAELFMQSMHRAVEDLEEDTEELKKDTEGCMIQYIEALSIKH